MSLTSPPKIRCIPATTNETVLRVFGTLMPLLLLLKKDPRQWLSLQSAQRQLSTEDMATWLPSHTDDIGRVGDTWVFVHRWQTLDFDPGVFAQAKVFLAQLTRRIQQEGYPVTAFDPLSPGLNLPRLAVEAGLGNLSPYGLLVHPRFGPRVILTAMKTDYPFPIAPPNLIETGGCTDCMVCVRKCPQHPMETGLVYMSHCKSCTRCLTVCPVGMPRKSSPAQ